MPSRRILESKEHGKPTTIRQNSEILDLRNTLSRNLLELRKSQRIYMPGLGPLFEDDDPSDDSIKLWLPSELSQQDRVAWCLPGIPGLELRFRYAQADDSLAEVRRLRRMLQGLHDQNTKHLSGAQRSLTRTNGVFEGFKTKVKRAVMRYRRARQALVALDPSQQLSPEWMHRFQVLTDADVRGPGREPDDKSEGKFQPSWIWLVPRLPNVVPGSSPNDPTKTPSTTQDPNDRSDVPTTSLDDPELVDSMRVHWAKCQARADRYEEEVELIVEEMGRTLRYFEWKKAWWTSLQSQREASATPPPPDVQRGLRAYACRQSHTYETLITSFANRWRGLLVAHGLGATWLQRYPVAVDPLSSKHTRGHFKSKSPECGLVPTSEPPLPTNPPSLLAMIPQPNSPPPGSSITVSPPNADMSVDPSLGSDEESDDGSDYIVGEGEGFDFDD